MIITIDGPSASGKSTVARQLAQQLNYYYVYSGLIYRALAYVLLHVYNYQLEVLSHPKSEDINAIIAQLIYSYTPQEKERVLFAQADITHQCKDAIIDQAASVVSTNSYVRTEVNTMQHQIAKNHNAIIDGRDAGSVVFADATYKFFLTATLEVRAQRWMNAQANRATSYTLKQAQDYIHERDVRDASRTNAPLIIPADAHIIDTTQLTVQEVVDRICSILHF
jgi:cytidylate kinase